MTAPTSSGPRRPTRRGAILGTAATCLLAVSAAWTASAHAHREITDSLNPILQTDPRAVVRVETESRSVALTFDDGPDPAYTPAVLDILDHFGVRATFFMIGRNAAAHPQLVRRVLLAGHSIGNHTADHLWLDRLARAQVAAQISAAERTFGGQAVATEGLFRPPRGLTSPTVASVTAQLGLRSYYWNTCLEANLRHHGLAQAAAATVAHAGPGGIVLCHDGGTVSGPNPQHIDRSRTIAALPALVSGLLESDLHPVTIPELMASRSVR